MAVQVLIVLGAGESGTGAAVLAKKKGLDVFVSDNGKIEDKYKNVLSNHGIEYEEGKHTEKQVLDVDEVVKSPGIPEDAPLVLKLREKGIKVISEIEFAGRYTAAKIIGITGSNGKTTTTLLIHHILKRAGLNVGLAGNVGKSLAIQVAEETHDYYVVELSSFQLDGMYDFKADIAILLNITPDHLDRYGNDMNSYADSKLRIAQNQTEQDSFIYCDDDEVIKKQLKRREIKAKKLPFSIQHQVEEGAYLNNNELFIHINKQQLTMTIQELALQGKHNIYNSMAAGIAAKVLDLRKDTIRECLSDFQNIEHRMEFVTNVHGMAFINDSKATNVNSSWYALESINNPIIWIVGGVDKGNKYSMLQELVKQKVKAIICLGKDNEKIRRSFKKLVNTMVDAESITEAVSMAYQLGEKGDTVLLSPACASFDLFKNYEDRGRRFKEAVRAL